MQVIKNADLRNPNVCAICEESPDGDTVVDTERFTPFYEVYPLNGRKYICERCAGEIANKIGYVSSNAIAQAQADADAARAELGNVRQRTTELADHIRDFVSSPASVDSAASAVALEAVFNQSDSAAKAAVEAPAVVVDVSTGTEVPADQVETRSYDEVFGAPEAAPAATGKSVSSKAEPSA